MLTKSLARWTRTRIRVPFRCESTVPRVSTLNLGDIAVYSSAEPQPKEEAILIDASPLIWLLVSRGVSDASQVIPVLQKTCQRIIAKRKPRYGALVLDSPGSKQQKQALIESVRNVSITSNLGRSKVDAQTSRDVKPKKDKKEEIQTDRLDFQYKGNRVKTSSGDVVGKVLSMLQDGSVNFTAMPVLANEKTEADDVIATLTRKVLEMSSSANVLVLSSDKDFFQLLTDDRVTVARTLRQLYTRTDEINRTWVRAHIGIEPEQFIDYLALCGDAADNVPGVAGIGPVRAQQLLAQYGTLERVLDASVANQHTSAMWKELAQSQAVARLSRQLVTLNQNLELSLPNGATSWSSALSLN